MRHDPQPLQSTSGIKSRTDLKKAVKERRNWIAKMDEQALHSNDRAARVDANLRRNVVNQIDLKLSDVLNDKDVLFISFSGKDNPYFTVAKEIAEGKYGFKVVTGPAEKNDENLLGLSIKRTIMKASALLGIWTAEYEKAQSSRDGTVGDVPSVWLPYELGVAAATGIPFRLCIHSDIHKDFREKVESNHVHHVFNGGNFSGLLDDSIKDLKQRILELRISSGR